MFHPEGPWSLPPFEKLNTLNILFKILFPDRERYRRVKCQAQKLNTLIRLRPKPNGHQWSNDWYFSLSITFKEKMAKTPQANYSLKLRLSGISDRWPNHAGWCYILTRYQAFCTKGVSYPVALHPAWSIRTQLAESPCTYTHKVDHSC